MPANTSHQTAWWAQQERNSLKRRVTEKSLELGRALTDFLWAWGHPWVKVLCAVSSPGSVRLVVPVGGKQGGGGLAQDREGVLVFVPNFVQISKVVYLTTVITSHL